MSWFRMMTYRTHEPFAHVCPSHCLHRHLRHICSRTHWLSLAGSNFLWIDVLWGILRRWIFGIETRRSGCRGVSMSKRRYVKYEQLKHNRAKESAAQFWGLFPFPSVTLIPVEPPFLPAPPSPPRGSDLAPSPGCARVRPRKASRPTCYLIASRIPPGLFVWLLGRSVVWSFGFSVLEGMRTRRRRP